MRNIFTRNEFLHESRWTGSISNNNQYDEVVIAIDSFINKEFKYPKSFKGGYYSQDYEEDIKNLNKFLKSGLNIDLDTFMEKYKSEIYSDDFFTEHCGFLDSILYTYDNKFLLSGNLIGDNYNEYVDENLIKYEYGYDMYDLGRKYILQNYDTLEDFYFESAKAFWKYEYESIEEYRNLEYGVAIINKEDYENNLDNFSMADKRQDGSVAILDINKLIEYCDINIDDNDDIYDFADYLNKKFEQKKQDCNINGIKPFNYKYDGGINLLIVGFGDINLDNIPFNDLVDYADRIDMNNNTKKYNL